METLPAEQRRTVQLHRFSWQMRRSWDGSSFYRARFAAVGLDLASASGAMAPECVPLLRLEDLDPSADPAASATPFTVAPADWWAETERRPELPARVLTDGDLVHRADQVARALWAAGARRGIRLLGLDRHTESPLGGPLLLGARRLGLAVPTGPQTGERASRGEAVLVTDTSPSEPAGGVGPLRWAVHGPDQAPTTRPLAVLTIPFVGPALAFECPADGGLHWADDHFLVEIVGPDGQPAPSEATGTLVLTDLTREGSPLIRFWTGCTAVLDTRPCACGRTSARSPFVRPPR